MAFAESIRALEMLERLGIRHYLDGKLLDIGCGPEPVLPGATGVNVPARPGVLELDASPDSLQMSAAFQRGYFDAVYSSHCIEHISAPLGRTLEYWLTFLRPAGHLVLYLPDERFYTFDRSRPRFRNPEHRHYLTMEAFEWHLEQLNGTILHLAPDIDVRHGRYSFLVVFLKS